MGTTLPEERVIGAWDSSGEGPLVGRVRELRELHDAFEDACRGRGGVHIVLGDPGVGKTRLAAALAEHARAAGARVIWTRGWGRAAPAYWPWVEVVRGLTHGVDGVTLRRELGGAADGLLRLLPELAERLPDPNPCAAAEDDSETSRFALFDAVVALLRVRSAGGPVLILMDDLQAVDEGSLIALDFVSRMLRDAAVLLVVTMHERVPDRTPEAQMALQNILRSGRRLVLGGLSRGDVGRLIELTSGEPAAPALIDAVHAVTEGNPFFAREVLALLLAEGRLQDPPDELPLPDGVRETIRRRLEPLDEPQFATVELAAIIGRTFNLATLEHASALDRDSVLDALDAATELGLVEPVAGTLGEYRFSHVLIRDTLFTGMPIAARLTGHRVVGEALEQVYRGAIEAHLAQIAHHFLCAAPRGDIAKAVDYAERAAHRALDLLAYEQAADLFERALAVLERLDSDVARRAALLLGLGTAQSRAGRPAARATFEAAIAAARAIDADDVFARAALGVAPFALTPGYVDDAHVALLGEALERVGPADAPLRVSLLGSLAVALYWSDAVDRRAALAGEALEMARRLGDAPTLAIALSAAQLATTGPDVNEQGLAWLDELFAITARTGETVMSLAARSRHVDLLLELDDIDAADLAIETLARLARESRDPRANAFVPLHRARRAAMEGRLDDAQRILDEVAAVADGLTDSTVPITVASQTLLLTSLRHGPGEIAEGVRHYAAGSPAMPVWRAALAAALADLGRREEAILEFERLAADDFAPLPRDNLWLAAMALLSEAALSLELPDHAMALYRKLEPFAGRNVVLPTVGFLGPVELWLGVLAGVAGRDADALGWFAAATQRATRDGARLSATRTAIGEAAVLLRDGGPAARTRAEALLTSAASDAEQMGLPWLGQQVETLRAQLTGPAARTAASGLASDPGVAELRRIGDVWTITSHGRSIHLNDGRGVRLLALLLERPDSEMHSLDLVAAVDGAAPSGPLIERSGGQETEGRFGVQGGAGPALDAKAKEDYRERMAALEAALATAESRRDKRAAAAARVELDFVRRELASAVGIGGRDRETGSHAERARINVTRAIRSTLKRIAGYDERIGAELEAGVRTGTFCVYRPDPLRPVVWTVDRG
ncbi:MAG: AAA family ATPase [Solirubrobacteraceae bacterium]|nr:AAA family ATPase [Solirubrobacteraceae bacterium]